MLRKVEYTTWKHTDRWVSTCRWCGLRIVCLFTEGIRRLRLLQGEHASDHVRN
jgi:hypothetical protein